LSKIKRTKLIIKLTEFIRQLQFIASQMGSHPALDDSLSFYIERGDELIQLEIVEIDSLRTIGCNCWYGASIELKELYPLQTQGTMI